jgi:ribosome-binding factor A
VRTQKGKRSERVAERLKTELMDFLLRGGSREPALAFVYITDVAVTDDLRHARIYFRLTQPEVDANDRNAAGLALERASGYLRRELSPRLQLKYMPDFKFFWDDALDRAARVDAVLAEITSPKTAESRVEARDADSDHVAEDRDDGGEGGR